MSPTARMGSFVAAWLLVAFDGNLSTAAEAAKTPPAVGVQGPVGTLLNPKFVERLLIKKPGMYENYLVDGAYQRSNLVKITSYGVTLKNCEVRSGGLNGILVAASDVRIESCRIHHMLAGTFEKQQDAHGIAGSPRRLVVRNCEIYLVSGDAFQFDPDRHPWDDVLIENCTMWTAPLKKPAAGFRAGERPGENAVDTKQLKANPRSKIVIRNCLMHGWGQGQIQVQAALNLKENIRATVENCVFRDNDIALRLRGDTGPRGGALVTVRNSAIYRGAIGVRMEDGIRDLNITNLAFGDGVKQHYQGLNKVGPGYRNVGEFAAPPYEEAVAKGVHPPSADAKP